MRKVRAFLAGALVALACGVATNALAVPALAASTSTPTKPDLGSNVYVFNPGMPVSEIQKTVDAIAAQQIPNQFGAQRYALLFEPGVYGSSTNPLNFQIGYYTSVALGMKVHEVPIPQQ